MSMFCNYTREGREFDSPRLSSGGGKTTGEAGLINAWETTDDSPLL